MMETCTKCNTEFKEYRTPEAKLIQAIYGGPLCARCAESSSLVFCSKCNERVDDPIYYEGLPYCVGCLPGV